MHVRAVVDTPFKATKIGRGKLSPVAIEGTEPMWVFRPFLSNALSVAVHAPTGLIASYPRQGTRFDDVRGAHIYCASDRCREDAESGLTPRPRRVGIVAVLDLPEPVGILAQLPRFAGTARPVHLARRLREDAGLYMTHLPAQIRCFRCGAVGIVHGVEQVLD